MNNYLRSIILPIAFVAASGINNYAAMAASVNKQSIHSNTQIPTHQIPDRQITIAQSFPTPQSLNDEQSVSQAIALCMVITNKLNNDPNNSQLRRLYNSCVFLINRNSLCESLKIAAFDYNFTDCHQGLAEFYQQWGNRRL
jgi:hypothetical protein